MLLNRSRYKNGWPLYLGIASQWPPSVSVCELRQSLGDISVGILQENRQRVNGNTAVLRCISQPVLMLDLQGQQGA